MADSIDAQDRALADLLSGENLPSHVWAEADREAVFLHQLQAPVRLELGGLEPAREALIRGLMDANPGLLTSLRGLLERRDAPVEILAMVKAFARSMAVHPDATLPRDVARAICALTILAAWRDGRRITTLSEVQIASMGRWVESCDWIDDRSKQIANQATASLGSIDLTQPADVQLSDFVESPWLQSRLLDAPLNIGSTASVDGYDVLRVIAEGGMALVMLGRSPDDGSHVAIKVMKPSLLDSPRLVQRFVDEARHMSQLDHPNILKVIEWSARRSGPYYVMPFVARGSLAQLTRQGPLDAESVATISHEVAEALSVAHLRGITHRDVKPSNILLADDGRPLVSDFGLARTVFNDPTLDAANAVLEGSAPYVSPGVASGRAEDTRCDIYGLGATMYEMLTGQPPYRGETAAEVLAQVRAGPPVPILSVNPRASKPLVRICETCMARDLRDRYATIADVAVDLANVRGGSIPVGRARVKQKPTRTLLWVASLASLLGVLILGAVRLWDRPSTASVEPFRSTQYVAPLARQLQPTLRATRMLAEGSSGQSIRFSSHGRWLLHRVGSLDSGHVDLLDSTNLTWVRRLANTGGAIDVARDVPRALVVTAEGPNVVDLESGESIGQLPRAAHISFVALSADGTRAAWNGIDPTEPDVSRLRVFDLVSSRVVLDLPAQSSPATAGCFIDNSRLAVWSLNGPGIRIIDLERGAIVHSSESHALWGYFLRVSRDGQTLASAGQDSTTQIAHASDLTPIANRAGRWGDASGLALLDDGRLIVGDTPGQVFAYDASGEELWRYSHLRPTSSMDVSNDGRLMALTSNEGQAWIFELPDPTQVIQPTPLVVQPVAAGEIIRTSISNAHVSAAGLTRDGSTLFVATIAGELGAINTSDGSVRWVRRACASGIRFVHVIDDETIAIVTFADGIRRLRASDGTEIEAIDARAMWHTLAVAPDGSLVVADGDRFARREPQGTGMIWEVRQGNFTLDADVSPDGTLAAFGTNRFAVVVRDMADGKVRARLVGHEGFVSSVRFLPDSSQIISGATDGTTKLWDVSSGAVIHEFNIGKPATVIPLRQGRLMASVGEDSMKLWDLQRGSLVRTYPLSQGIRAAVEADDGRSLWTVGPGPLVRKWSVDPAPKLD